MERVLAHHVMQLGGGMCPQGQAVAEQKVEGAMLGNHRHQLAQGTTQLRHRRHVGVGFGQFLHQPAKSQFAVGVAHRLKAAMQFWRVIFQVAIVGKNPVAAPQLAHKRVAVFQRHLAHRGLAHMRHHVMTLDGITFEHLGNGRGGGTGFVDKMAHAFAGGGAVTLKKSDTPAVCVMIGTTAALRKAGKTQRQAGRQVAVHSQKLTHKSVALAKDITGNETKSAIIQRKE